MLIRQTNLSSFEKILNILFTLVYEILFHVFNAINHFYSHKPILKFKGIYRAACFLLEYVFKDQYTAFTLTRLFFKKSNLFWYNFLLSENYSSISDFIKKTFS